VCSSDCTFVWGANSAPQASWLDFREGGEEENGGKGKGGIKVGGERKERGGEEQGKETKGR